MGWGGKVVIRRLQLVPEHTSTNTTYCTSTWQGNIGFSGLVKDESYYLEPTRLKILPLPHSVHARATCIIKPPAICVDFLIYVYLSLNPAVYLFPLQQTQQERTEGSTSYLASSLASSLASYLASYLVKQLPQLMPPGRHEARGWFPVKRLWNFSRSPRRVGLARAAQEGLFPAFSNNPEGLEKSGGSKENSGYALARARTWGRWKNGANSGKKLRPAFARLIKRETGTSEILTNVMPDYSNCDLSVRRHPRSR